MFGQIRNDLKQKQSPKYLLITPNSSYVHAQRSVSFDSFPQHEQSQDAACFRRDLSEKGDCSDYNMPSSTRNASMMPYVSSRNTEEIDPAIFQSLHAQQVAVFVAHQQQLLARSFADSARSNSSNCPLAFDMGCRLWSFSPPPSPPLPQMHQPPVGLHLSAPFLRVLAQAQLTMALPAAPGSILSTLLPPTSSAWQPTAVPSGNGGGQINACVSGASLSPPPPAGSGWLAGLSLERRAVMGDCAALGLG